MKGNQCGMERKPGFSVERGCNAREREGKHDMISVSEREWKDCQRNENQVSVPESGWKD